MVMQAVCSNKVEASFCIQTRLIDIGTAGRSFCAQMVLTRYGMSAFTGWHTGHAGSKAQIEPSGGLPGGIVIVSTPRKNVRNAAILNNA